MAREFGVSYIAKEFKVPFNNLSRWEKQVERRKGAGRKVGDPRRESLLIEWVE